MHSQLQKKLQEIWIIVGLIFYGSSKVSSIHVSMLRIVVEIYQTKTIISIVLMHRDRIRHHKVTWKSVQADFLSYGLWFLDAQLKTDVEVGTHYVELYGNIRHS